MPNFVQEYRSTDQSSWPNLTGQAGSLIALLDAILVNGGTANTVTSLTEAGATITAVIPADTTLETNDYLVIAGASPAGANGTFRVTVTDSTHFTYTGPGSLGAITGTITYKRASLGWTKPFTGTNLAAYLPQPTATTGFPQFYLRVEEAGLTIAGQKEALVTGYETMSDINTGTGQFPTNGQQAISGTASRGGLCWRKSLATDATARAWTIMGDGATFYLVVNSDVSISSGRGLYGFGGFISFKAGDIYNVFIAGLTSFNTSAAATALTYASDLTATWSALNGIFAPRASSQIGGSVGMTQYSRSKGTAGGSGMVNGFQLWPNPLDGSLWVDSLLFFDGANMIRGRPRGYYSHCHVSNPFGNEYDLVTNIAGLSGITLVYVLAVYNSFIAPVLFDKYGPW